MAYVKVAYRKNADSLIKYVFKEKAPDDPAHGEDCPPNEQGAKNAFEAVRDLHKVKEGIQALHVIQSWSPEESKKLTAEHMNKMGQELAGRYFEGHQYLVVTHTHDDHHHNHIVVNSTHTDTGKRVTNKKKHLYKLRDISDNICRENGLSVIDGEAKQRRENMPDRAQKIDRYNGNSYIRAMKDKAQFARHYATNFDEYAGYLDALGVHLRIKDKTITYFYEDKAKGKRGDKLGREFTKEGLGDAFKRNHELFSARPELRARIRSEFERASGAGRSTLGASGGVLLDGRDDARHRPNDVQAYTKSSRAYGDRSTPSDDKLRNSIIPIEAIRHARTANILEYCVRNKIGLMTNERGKRALQGRPHVELEETTWTNTRNKTKGTAIELVATHGNLTYLQSIAKINNTPSLLELETHFGPASRKFTSFHVPRRHEAAYPAAIERLGRFLTSFGTNPGVGEALLMSDQARVRRNGAIRLYPKGDNKNSLEFVEDEFEKWQPKRRGRFKTPFHSSRGSGETVVLFTDPKQYIQKRGKELFADRKRNDGILVLMEPNEDRVADYLKSNPHVKTIEIVTTSPSKPAQGELDFFGNLKSKLTGLEVKVHFTGQERALTRRGLELSI
ncbi:relaxase/mobilization nuclease domain-containing protein [Bdellovibrionota bacterium FG-1]